MCLLELLDRLLDDLESDFEDALIELIVELRFFRLSCLDDDLLLLFTLECFLSGVYERDRDFDLSETFFPKRSLIDARTGSLLPFLDLASIDLLPDSTEIVICGEEVAFLSPSDFLTGDDSLLRSGDLRRVPSDDFENKAFSARFKISVVTAPSSLSLRFSFVSFLFS